MHAADRDQLQIQKHERYILYTKGGEGLACCPSPRSATALILMLKIDSCQLCSILVIVNRLGKFD